MLFERLHQIKERAAAELFVDFCNFAREACGAVTQNRQGVGERFRDAVRGFVENDGAIFDAQVLESAAAFAGTRRKEAKKKEFFVRQTGSGESSKQSGSAGNRNYG